MRMAFGLTGVLVMLGVAMWIIYSFELPTVQLSKPAHDQALTWSGQTDTGRRFQDTYATQAALRPDGKLAYLQIIRMDTDSPLGKTFHAQLGDAIVGFISINGFKQETPEFQQSGDAETQLLEVCLNPGQIIVNRGGNILLLPDGTPASNMVHLTSVKPPPVPQPQPQPTAVSPASAQPQSQPAIKSNPGDKGDQPTEDDPLNGIRRRLHALPGE